ncbi:hypothetical protein J7J24_00720 [bacterium]|nr:hypothetical protein [bacterium]
MFPYLPTFIHSFVDGIVFLFSGILLTFPKDKFFKEKKILFVFWMIAGITFLINTAQVLFFGLEMRDISFLFLKIMMCFILAQFSVGAYFLFFKLFKSQFLLNIILIALGIFSLAYTYIYFTHAQYEIVFGEPRIVLPNQPSASYLSGFSLVILLFFGFRILYKDLKEYGFAGKSLASIYRLFAVIIYGGIAFLRTFYFLPHPWYLEIFYFLIPVLHYLSVREEIKSV